jgi:hypothetical protein
MACRGHNTRNTGCNHLRPKDTSSKVGTCVFRNVNMSNNCEKTSRCSVSCTSSVLCFFSQLQHFRICEMLVNVITSSFSSEALGFWILSNVQNSKY